MNVIFMGRKSYAAELLEWTVQQGINVLAVVTDSHFANSPTKDKADKLGIPVISLEEAEKMVEDDPNKIDLVISYLFWRKIKEPLISTPKYGCINFHPAILPDWKGTAGYNVAILNKLEEWGATAHYVNENIDTGDIIKIYKFNFDYRHETAISLEEKTQKIQVDLYKSIITDIKENGRLDCIQQPKEAGIYISRNEMESMKEIDLKNDDIDLKIRAFWFPPYTGAYIDIDGKKYTLINEYILRSLAKDGETSNS